MKRLFVFIILSISLYNCQTKNLIDYFGIIDKSQLLNGNVYSLIDSLGNTKRKKIPYKYVSAFLCETKNEEYINPFYPRRIYFYPLFKIKLQDSWLMFYDSFDGTNKKTYVASYDAVLNRIIKRLLILHTIEGLSRDADFHLYEKSPQIGEIEIVIKQIYPSGIEGEPRCVKQSFLLDRNFSSVNSMTLEEMTDDNIELIK